MQRPSNREWMMFTLTINNKQVKVRENATLLEIIRKMGISIPTLCYHPDLVPHGSCRLCTVEVSKNGKTRMVTACNFPVQEKIEVKTHSDRVIQLRRTLVELLLARCPEVPVIQNLARDLRIEKGRFHAPHPENDCILCGLCIRTCNEIVGAHAIGFSRRGTLKKVGTPFEVDSDQCIACGACEFICPTGAIKMEMDRARKIKLSGTGMQRPCRYALLGLVDFMVCSNGFECWRCEVDQGMEDRFKTHPAFAIKPAKNLQPLSVAGFIFHPDLFYSNEHVWAKPMDQRIRLGIDGMASVLAVEADSLILPSVGSSLRRKETLAEVVSGHKRVIIPSPLSGTVSAVNRDVVESPNLAWRDPYRRGWLVMIGPDPSEDIFRLYSGENAKVWFAQQANHLAGLCSKRKRNVCEGQSVRKTVRKHWDEFVEQLFHQGEEVLHGK